MINMYVTNGNLRHIVTYVTMYACMHVYSAGRYQKLSNSIYCLRLIHDMNKYFLFPKFS